MKWTENGPDLIHISKFDEIPDGTKLISIMGKHAIKGQDKIDMDTRFGFLAWSIYRDEDHMSRDPKRIAEVLAELGTYWMNNPDLRLYQIMGNMLGKHFEGIEDGYYIEDDRVLEALRKDNGRD